MGVAWRPAGGEHLLNTRSSTAKSRKSEKKLKFFVFPSLLSLIEDINGEVGGWMVSDLVEKCSAVMAPTCYSMKNLHYRTQSLPESVHQYNHLLNAHLGSSHHHPDYELAFADPNQIPLQCRLRPKEGGEPKTVYILIPKQGLDLTRLFDKNVKVVVKDLMIMDISPK